MPGGDVYLRNINYYNLILCISYQSIVLYCFEEVDTLPKEIRLVATSPSVQHLCNCDKDLSLIIKELGPLSYSIHEDGYSFLVHEIIEQMLSTKTANGIFNRFSELCNNTITIDSVSNLSSEEISSVGISRAKVEYIKSLTLHLSNNPDFLESLSFLSNEQVISELKSIHGIGNWTAKMYLIFVLDRQDIIPIEDSAFIKSYRLLRNNMSLNKEQILKDCSKWSPYSSIAARYLYRALDSKLFNS